MTPTIIVMAQDTETRVASLSWPSSTDWRPMTWRTTPRTPRQKPRDGDQPALTAGFESGPGPGLNPREAGRVDPGREQRGFDRCRRIDDRVAEDLLVDELD
jgi:hypothetical protein